MTERGEPAQEERGRGTVPHGEESDVGAPRGDGFAGRPSGGRQTECSGVSGTSDGEGGVLTRQPPDRRGVGRSEESGEPNCGSSPAAAARPSRAEWEDRRALRKDVTEAEDDRTQWRCGKAGGRLQQTWQAATRRDAVGLYSSAPR